MKSSGFRECSDAQWAYIRRLLGEAFAKGYTKIPNLDRHHMPTYYSSEQASVDLQNLLAAKANNWGREHGKAN